MMTDEDKLFNARIALLEAETMLSQAKFSLRCYEHPEPIEAVALRCGVTVERAQEIQDRQDAEAAKMGRTIPLLQDRVKHWEGKVDDCKKVVEGLSACQS
jgi:hypothetical protein